MRPAPWLPVAPRGFLLRVSMWLSLVLGGSSGPPLPPVSPRFPRTSGQKGVHPARPALCADKGWSRPFDDPITHPITLPGGGPCGDRARGNSFRGNLIAKVGGLCDDFQNWCLAFCSDLPRYS
jgi:hypothetical protein